MSRGSWLPAAVAGVAIVVLAWGLALPLPVTLRGDELVSLFRYSALGPSAIWGSYIPNDHMLYELLTWGLRELTGDHTSASVRFWAVVPAIASVVVLTVWSWRRLDPWVAAVFAVLMAASPVFSDVSSEGRGYGLACLAVAVMLIGADLAARRTHRHGIAIFAVSAVVAIWTVPVSALAVAAMAGLLVAKLGPRRELLLSVAAIAVASLVFYAPVLGDVIHSAGQKDGQQLPLAGFITGPLRDLLQPTAETLIHPVTTLRANDFLAHVLSNARPPSSLGADLLAAVAVGAGVMVLLFNVERFLAAALLVPVLFTYVLLEVFRSYVISRFASFLLPPLIILIAAGLVGIGRELARTRSVAAVIAVAAAILCALVLGKAYRLLTIDGRPQAQRIVSNQPTAFGRYVSAGDITEASVPQLQALACDREQPFLLFLYEPDHVTPHSLPCLAHRLAYKIVNLSLDASHGARVPGVVLDVPGVFPRKLRAFRGRS